MIFELLGYLGSWLVAMALGFGVVDRVWPRSGVDDGTLPLRLTLSILVGLGVSSCLLFGWLLAAGSVSVWFVALELVAVAAVLAPGRSGRRSAARGARPAPTGAGGTVSRPMLAAAALTAAAAVASLAIAAREDPHGGWDAWAIWNLRARFLFRAGTEWERAFSGLLGWSHPDYPLLLPLSVVRGWVYLGRESWMVSAVLAAAGTLLAAATVYGGLRSIRGRNQALLGGAVVLGTPTFVIVGASQYADVLLSCYLTSAVVLFCVADAPAAPSRRPLVLAGLTAGLAAWTKNEGWLFLLALVAARAGVALRRRGYAPIGRQLPAFLAGAAPILLWVLVFKVATPAANDLVSGQGWGSTVARFADGGRYLTIVSAIARNLAHPLWAGLPMILVGYVWIAGRLEGGAARGGRFGGWVLALIGCGYFIVYLATPRDLAWHLDTSLTRLMVHLWPSAVFVAFLVARDPFLAEPTPGAADRGSSPGIGVA